VSQDYFVDLINKRLIINKYPQSNFSVLVKGWINLAKKNDLTKIWLLCFPHDTKTFENYGFSVEGVIESNSPNSLSVSMAYFLSTSRSKCNHQIIEDEIVARISSKKSSSSSILSQDFTTSLLNSSNCEAISSLLGEIFSTYPTPVSNPSYIVNPAKKYHIPV